MAWQDLYHYPKAVTQGFIEQSSNMSDLTQTEHIY